MRAHVVGLPLAAGTDAGMMTARDFCSEQCLADFLNAHLPPKETPLKGCAEARRRASEASESTGTPFGTDFKIAHEAEKTGFSVIDEAMARPAEKLGYYKILAPGDIVQEGDEVMCAGEAKYVSASGLVGSTVNPNSDVRLFRRPL